MKRTLQTARIDEKTVRYRVRVEDFPSAPESQEYLDRQAMFLIFLGKDPMLLDCNGHTYQTLKMFHNGDSWVAEAEVKVSDRQTL